MKINLKKSGLWLGLLLFLLLLFLPTPNGLSPRAHKTAAVALLMIIWWITEAIPIYITAFLPIVLFPILGILTSAETTKNYGHDYVLMLLGAFILAKGIEKQNLHKRISLLTIGLLGTSKRKIILGFMMTTALLSMWITNMAVVLIMLPIAMALISKEEKDKRKNFGTALLLGIAYAASIGGTGTLIGTPPNLVFAGLMTQIYPNAPDIDFMEWMKIGLPIVLLFIPIIWFYIVRFFKINDELKGGEQVISNERQLLGKITSGEKNVLIIFILQPWVGFLKRISLLGISSCPDGATYLVSQIMYTIAPSPFSAQFFYFWSMTGRVKN